MKLLRNILLSGIVLSLLNHSVLSQCSTGCLTCVTSTKTCTKCDANYRLDQRQCKDLPSPANVSVQTSLIVLLGVAAGLGLMFAIILFVVYWNCWRPQDLMMAKRKTRYNELTPEEGGAIPSNFFAQEIPVPADPEEVGLKAQA